jgi:hypothetical protein
VYAVIRPSGIADFHPHGTGIFCFTFRPAFTILSSLLLTVPEHTACRDQSDDLNDERDRVHDDTGDGDPLAGVLCLVAVGLHKRNDAKHRHPRHFVTMKLHQSAERWPRRIASLRTPVPQIPNPREAIASPLRSFPCGDELGVLEVLIRCFSWEVLLIVTSNPATCEYSVFSSVLPDNFQTIFQKNCIVIASNPYSYELYIVYRKQKW